jgi:(heptosyl)LPS beta-1,4-glucosyltransferase
MEASPAPLTICIVSNRLDDKLEALINMVSGHVQEILIGFDGDVNSIPPPFNRENKASVIEVKWQGFSATKNELATKATSDWILSLDSDEIPDEKMLKEMKALPWNTFDTNLIFSLKRISFFEEKKITHGAWGRDRVWRLYNKNHTQWDNAEVHENLEKKNDSTIVNLGGLLYHYTADDFNTFLEKNKNYARLSALKYFNSGKKSPLWKRVLSPVFTFIKEFIFQGGFMDGSAGFKIAKSNALYTHWKYHFLKQKYQDPSISS